VSVLVVVRRRARPDQAEALVAAMTATMEPPHPVSSRWARLFQCVTDPRTVLYMGEWRSREAYQTRDNSPPVPLDALCTGRPRRWFRQELDRFEAAPGPFQALTCSIFRAPPTRTAALITYLIEQSGPALYRQPGIVLRALYQDLDHPNRIISIRGWRAIADLEAARCRVSPGVDAAVELLGARAERFTGRLRREVDRRQL
jgi:quinol monooxygenase YgiN